MWGIEEIKANNERAAEEWHDEHDEYDLPVLDHEDDADPSCLRIPFIGDAADDVSKEHIEQLFVDISGLGGPHEPALTQGQMLARLKELIKEHGPIMVAMSEHGQFQGYVEVWKAV